MSVNKKRTTTIKVEKAIKTAHRTFEGGMAFDVNDPFLRLQCVAASSFFGEPGFYRDGDDKPKTAPRQRYMYGGFGVYGEVTPINIEDMRSTLGAIGDPDWKQKSTKEVMEACIDAALAVDPEATLKLAVELRKVDLIRTTPQVILVRAANHPAVKGTGLIREYNPEIMRRADEPAVQMAYQLSEFGKPVPNSLRRSWARFLKNADAYQLAKYSMKNRVVKTVDVASIALGKGFYGYTTPIGQLMRGELKLGGEVQTWESIRSGGGTWEEAIKVMGHMALLRNLRNFVGAGVDPKLFIDKLVGTAKHGKQLPFRYWVAYRELQGAPGKVLDAIEECLHITLENLPMLGGKSLILTDNSGSMRGGRVSGMGSTGLMEVANLMGVLTGMRSDEGIVGTFANRLAYYSVRKRASVFDQLHNVAAIGAKQGGGTNNPLVLALTPAIKDRVHFDNIFVYSDMQAMDGGLFLYGSQANAPRLIEEYRNKVNPNVHVFLVQMGGYDDTLLPEYYEKTYVLGGWSNRILDFAIKMHRIFD